MRTVDGNGVSLRLVLTGLWILACLPALAQAQRWVPYQPLPCPCPAPTPAVPAPVPSEKAPTAQPPAQPLPSPLATPPALAPSDIGSNPEDSSSSSGSMLAMFDSSVGYIDSAITGNQIRLRYDVADHANRYNRAEYFFPKGAPSGPGLAKPESSVDYQVFSTYIEHAFSPRLSGFVELPVRFLDPTVNSDHAGFGDMNIGGKYRLIDTKDQVATFQWRTYIPTGNANQGLGNDHVSLEPAFLYFQQVAPKVRFESELRFWQPIGGTNFAGDLLQYGVGFSYGERPQDRFWINPVVEFVAWTILGGKESVVNLPGDTAVPKSAAGDTIVNGKFGLRMGLGQRSNLYVGYGRAFTGDVWYKNMFRLELRYMY